jgi:glutamate racemase
MADVQPGSTGAPIGVFDSGVGGLSVLRELRRWLPAEHFEYVADQAHVPYAPRPAQEVQLFAAGVAGFLLGRGAKMIVVACNTASVAALAHLRRTFPETPFVGMDPAVKPAAAATRSGRIGVLATTGTFRSDRYGHLVREFARGVEVLGCPCPGLVELIEGGRGGSPEAVALLKSFLEPMVRQGVDTLVLGCTHFPLAWEQIQAAAGPSVCLIDPAPAVACQVERLLRERGSLAAASPATASRRRGQVALFTTGRGWALQSVAERVLGERSLPLGALRWAADGVLTPPMAPGPGG